MLKKFFFICILMLFFTACVSGPKKPLYQNVAPDEQNSILQFDNKCSMSMLSSAPYLSVDLDGFSPSEKKWLPKGITELRITPGSHQLTVKGEFKTTTAGHYDPVSIIFRTEPGKAYKITFEFFTEGFTRGGFKILYEGWPEEESSKFPQKSMWNSILT